MEFSFKDTLMFYQTSLRNVGLYTSISLAHNITFIILSMMALFLAFSILRNLIRHVTLFRDGLKDESQKAMINEYLTISNALQYVLLTVSGFSAYTLYRQV
jgi:hypothetical protein